jgi:TPR repeat protein
VYIVGGPAEPWLLDLATAGDTRAMIAAGDIDRELAGDDAAASWYRRAAGDGDPAGFARLAGIAWDERVNTGDGAWAVEALHLFRLAAQGGHVEAMMAVAGQTDDPDERELWRRRAAEAGDAFAMSLYADSLAARGQPDETARWRQRAAEEGERLDRLTGPDGPEPFGAHVHTPVTTVTITTELAAFVRQILDWATETDMVRHVRLGVLFVRNGGKCGGSMQEGQLLIVRDGDRALQLWADASSEAVQALGRLDLATLRPGRLYWRQADRSWQVLG